MIIALLIIFYYYFMKLRNFCLSICVHSKCTKLRVSSELDIFNDFSASSSILVLDLFSSSSKFIIQGRYKPIKVYMFCQTLLEYQIIFNEQSRVLIYNNAPIAAFMEKYNLTIHIIVIPSLK